MAYSASGQAKLASLVAAGVSKKEAMKSLVAEQKAAQSAAPRSPDAVDRMAAGIGAGPGGIDNAAALAARNAAAPVDTLTGSDTTPVGAAWSLEGDPTYQAAIASGQSQFNIARANALAAKQADEASIAASRKSLDKGATESRRRLAGNYAARGMAGGAAGALTLAEAEANAQQIAARTSLQDQLSTLNSQYLANFGDATAKGYDWTGTLTGQQYKTAAAQAAIQSQLAKYGVA